MTIDDVRQLLRDEVGKAPNASTWAKAHGLTKQHLHDVLKGSKEPGPAVLAALGVTRTRTTWYEREPLTPAEPARAAE